MAAKIVDGKDFGHPDTTAYFDISNPRSNGVGIVLDQQKNIVGMLLRQPSLLSQALPGFSETTVLIEGETLYLQYTHAMLKEPLPLADFLSEVDKKRGAYGDSGSTEKDRMLDDLAAITAALQDPARGHVMGMAIGMPSSLYAPLKKASLPPHRGGGGGSRTQER